MKVPLPTSVMNHSLVTPSSVAWVMYQKYVQAVPLFRQEKEWERMGLVLPRFDHGLLGQPMFGAIF